MKILLIDIDSIWFNLAVMHLSSYHKELGDEVYLLRYKHFYRNKLGSAINLERVAPSKQYDKVYVSCIFSQNRGKALSVAKMYESLGSEVSIGGSGIDPKITLPKEIEHTKPDYTLYNLDYSVGFLTRGCIRDCPWCIVPRKEGTIRVHSPLKEFLDRRHDKVMLLDNNLLAHPDHEELLLELLISRLNVCFTQGLDIRLIDDRNANLLAHLHYKDDEFKNPRLYFSWDILGIEDDVLKGVKTLKSHGIPPSSCLFYVLCGFQVQPDEYDWDYFMAYDWYRYQRLSELGVLPYIMIYNSRRDIPLLCAFKRWVNVMFKAKLKYLGRLDSFKTFLQKEYPNII